MMSLSSLKNTECLLEFLLGFYWNNLSGNSDVSMMLNTFPRRCPECWCFSISRRIFSSLCQVSSPSVWDTCDDSLYNFLEWVLPALRNKSDFPTAVLFLFNCVCSLEFPLSVSGDFAAVLRWIWCFVWKTLNLFIQFFPASFPVFPITFEAIIDSCFLL